MFTTPEVLINLFADSILYVLLLLAFLASVQIVLHFDPRADTPLQYRLQKRSYLVATLIFFALLLKILLFFYFIYTLDHLSNIIPGAMCAAGVVTANEYGVWLVLVKLLNLYLFSFWLLLHRKDEARSDYELTKKKFAFFVFIFLMITLEFMLEWLYFAALDVGKIVSCCGVLFNPVASSSLFGSLLLIPYQVIVGLFYAFFVLFFFVRGLLFRLLHLLWIPLSILAIITFFSPYIYELPTHRCPFCMLQSGYGYIGYFIYTALFLGTFFGMAGQKRRALLFDSLAVGILTFYVVSYWVKNGVWLF